MKKLLISLVILSVLCIIPNVVKASEEYYINSNGVKIQIDNYNRLCDLYSKSYVEYMDNNEYQFILSKGIDNIEVTEIQDNFSLTRETTYSTANKRVKITKIDNIITLLAQWITVPKVKSYDVIGVRFGSGVTIDGFLSFTHTYIDTNGKSVVSNTGSNKYLIDGAASSFQLKDGTSQEAWIRFKYKGSGYIYGSYQHAAKSATLAESRKYTFSPYGKGGVFDFESSVSDKYDAMGGVEMKV